MSLRVRVDPAAEAQVQTIDAWWRENRPAAPAMFSDELEKALELIAEAPDIGRRYRARARSGVRRVLLTGSRYHVYYARDRDRDELLVLAVWSAHRGRGPTLPKT